MVLLAGVTVVIVLTIAIISTLGRFNRPEALTILSTPAVSAVEICDELFPPDMYPMENYISTEKAIMWATESVITRTPFPTPIMLPTGIYENERTKHTGALFGVDAQNAWVGYVNGDKVTLFAGSTPENVDQGAIVLLIDLSYRGFHERILTPTQHGAVRVVSEQNNRLTLVAADGTIYYFDVPARRFVDSMDEIVLTATPPPTYTPFMNPKSEPTATLNPYP